MRYDISFANLVLSPDEKYAIIAGGEIYGFGCRKEDTFYMTMNTTTLNMRSLGDKDKTLHTNNVLKMKKTIFQSFPTLSFPMIPLPWMMMKSLILQ